MMLVIDVAALAIEPLEVCLLLLRQLLTVFNVSARVSAEMLLQARMSRFVKGRRVRFGLDSIEVAPPTWGPSESLCLFGGMLVCCLNAQVVNQFSSVQVAQTYPVKETKDVVFLKFYCFFFKNPVYPVEGSYPS